MTTTFAALGLSDPILRSLVELGYEEPTPVQAQAITLLLAGSDLIAQAQTGTGKTAAFALPIIERLAEGAKAGRAPQALVMTPTRELAMQVAEAVQPPAQLTVPGRGKSPQLQTQVPTSQ